MQTREWINDQNKDQGDRFYYCCVLMEMSCNLFWNQNICLCSIYIHNSWFEMSYNCIWVKLQQDYQTVMTSMFTRTHEVSWSLADASEPDCQFIQPRRYSHLQRTWPWWHDQTVESVLRHFLFMPRQQGGLADLFANSLVTTTNRVACAHREKEAEGGLWSGCRVNPNSKRDQCNM